VDLCAFILLSDGMRHGRLEFSRRHFTLAIDSEVSDTHIWRLSFITPSSKLVDFRSLI
jgi:hypothetical protein